MSRHAAIDLGASSGRVAVAEIGPDRLELREVHRFSNGPHTVAGTLRWDIRHLYAEALTGLAATGPVATVGVDSWAVDFGLLDGTGHLLDDPFHYRDTRTAGAADTVHGVMPFPQLYRHNGLQLLPFTTLYQLAVADLDGADKLVLIPDLITYWLTGNVGCEVTNASTTGLLDVRTRGWSAPVLAAAGLDRDLLPELCQPGDVRGPLLPAAQASTGLDGRTSVVAVGSHDTASAVVATPLRDDRAAFLSLGTWGLIGVELGKPVLTAASREANVTNELGVDGRVRYLRNVMGLWLLQESLRHWRRSDLKGLLADAGERPPGPVIDVADIRLWAPGDLPARITEQVREAGHRPPRDAVEVVRIVLDSLATAFAAALAQIASLSRRDIDILHVVGGGARNALLCQMTADACGIPVIAGPVEATALGNVLVQARAHGAITGDLWRLRELVARTQPLTRFEPRA